MSLTLLPLPSALESAYTRSTRVTNNACLEAAIDRPADARREARHRGDAVPKRAAVAEQRCEPTRGAPRWRGNGSVTFTNVAVGGPCGEAWCLRLERLHVRHRFFHTQRVRLLGARREVGGGCTSECLPTAGALLSSNNQSRFCKSSGETYRSRVDTGNDSISFLAFSDRIVIDTEFLGNEMNNPPLLRRKRPRER